MKHIHLLKLLILSSICLVGCNENQDIFIPDEPIEVGASGNITSFTNAIVTDNENFAIPLAEEGGQTTTNRGTAVHFPPNSFMTEEGQIISGEVDIEITEVYSKGNMIKTGIFPIADGWPLLSIGQYFIEARQGEERLSLAQEMAIQFVIPLSEPVNQDIIGFIDDTTGGIFNWQNHDTIAYNLENSSVDTSLNSLNRLGWVNYAIYLDTLNTTNINIEFPSMNYNGDNTAVYVIFNDYNTVIPAQAVGEGVFSINKIPIGYNVKIISITEQNSVYFFSKKDLTSSEEVIVELSPSETLLENIIIVLDGL